MSYRTSRSFEAQPSETFYLAHIQLMLKCIVECELELSAKHTQVAKLQTRISELENPPKQHERNCFARVGGKCSCGLIRYCNGMYSSEGSGSKQIPCTARFENGEWFDLCGEPCRWIMQKSGEGKPPWP